MQIAFDSKIFALQEYGGISRYYFELADNIARSMAAEVRILCPLYVNSYLASASPQLRVAGRKMPAFRRSGSIYSEVNRLIVPKMIKDFRPDILHETYYSKNKSEKHAKRVVLTVFDMIHEIYPTGVASWDSSANEKAAAVARADHIICISEQTRSDLIDILNVDRVRTSVIHLGFSLTGKTEFSCGQPERPYILFVGSRSGYKNFSSLLRVYASHGTLSRDFDLVAFGGGGFNFSERQSIKTFGLSASSVRHIGGTDVTLAGLYSGAALFVFPSLYEGFGIPPLEAMSFDCPVACSNTSSIPEVVGDAAQLFIPSSDESIEKAIESVVYSPSLRATLVAKGRERIKSFSWEKCAQQTMDVYRNLLI